MTLSFKLADEFVGKYSELPPPFGFVDAGGNSLGEITFLRTYSRMKDDGTKERWVESARRITDATYSIQKEYVKSHKLEWNDQKGQTSAKEFFDRLFNLKWTPPGRGLQQMGSPQVMGGNSASLQNCSAVSTGSIDRHNPGEVFAWSMLALMYGVGVGADTLGSHKNIQIRERSGDPEVFVVPDSREGWAESLRLLINSFLRNNRPVEFDYSLIRPKGAPLVSFGGVASGPDPLKHLHQSLERIFTERLGKTLDSETITDIMNLIGACVIAGSTRRSAELILGEEGDEDFLNLKNPEFFPERNSYDPDNPGHGWASNNSISVTVGSDYDKYVDRIATNGEPGLIWLDVTRTHGRMKDGIDDKDRRVSVFNPCSEQPLESMEMCTLTTVHVNNAESKSDFLRTLKFAFLYAKTVTLLPTPWTKTNSIMQRNRRIGLSITGITDFVDEHGLPTLIEWMEAGYDEVRRLDKTYSEWLCIRESNRVTTVKPEGCRPWDAVTTTSRGVLTLEELFALSGHVDGETWHDVDKSMSALQGTHSDAISKTFDNGKAEVFSVKMSYGMEVQSTGSHKWFVTSRYDRSKKNRWSVVNDWVDTKNLRRGDVLDVKLGVYDSTEEATLRAFDSRSISMRNDAVSIIQPKQMSPQIAWLLGYLWGDGAMSPSSYRLRFIDQSIHNLQKAQRIILEEFGLTTNLHPASDGKNAHTLEVGSKILWHWLIKNSVWKYDTAGDIDLIPEVVRSSSKESIIAFIAGLIDADGCVGPRQTERTVTLASASKSFSKHVQDVAAAVGIMFGRSHNTKGENKQKRKSMWLMTIGPDTLIESNALLISHSEKMKNHPSSHLPWSADARETSKNRILGKVESVESMGEMETFDVEVENSHWYYAGSVRSHNSVSLLSGASPGVHWGPGGKFYLRAIRFGNADQMLHLFKSAGYKVEADLVSSDTSVVYFPMKTDSTRSEKEVSIFEKIGLAAKAQHHWSDNGVSVTVSFDPETETSLIVPALRLHEGSLKAVSFLPMSNTAYPQQPYTSITEEEYYSYLGLIKKVDFSAIYDAVDNLDVEAERFCTTDSCLI